jgi:hypothetical protein
MNEILEKKKDGPRVSEPSEHVQRNMKIRKENLNMKVQRNVREAPSPKHPLTLADMFSGVDRQMQVHPEKWRGRDTC